MKVMGRTGRFFVRKGGYIYRRDWIGVYIMLNEASRQLAPLPKKSSGHFLTFHHTRYFFLEQPVPKPSTELCSHRFPSFGSPIQAQEGFSPVMMLCCSNQIYKNNQNAPIESNFLDALLRLY